MNHAPEAMTPSRPQVLYLVHRVPYPPNRGDRIRSFRILDYLAQHADVHLAFLDFQPTPPETLEALNQRCRRVAVMRVPRLLRLARGALSLAAGKTATEGFFGSPALCRIIERWAADTDFDAVIAFCSSMFQYARLPALAGKPLVVDLVDVDSQKWFDYAAQSAGLRRWLYRIEGRRLRQLEIAVARQAKAVLVVTEAEAQLYRSFCPDAPLHVMPNGVAADYSHFEGGTASGHAARSHAERCVFVGALDYQANVDGLRWFCTEVWPEVHRRRPQAAFLIVGSNPVPAVSTLATLPGVQLLADVPDVRPYLASAAVVLAPLRIARGIQNKVLQGLAMGKAVLASPQAIEGLAVQPDVHLLQASTPQQWVEAIFRLLDDPELRARLGHAGRDYTQQHHRWEDHLRVLGRLLGWEGRNDTHHHRSAPAAPQHVAQSPAQGGTKRASAVAAIPENTQNT